MKTIGHISFKNLVFAALAMLCTLSAKAQMTDNGYANIDWQYNFPVSNAFTRPLQRMGHELRRGLLPD